MKTGKIIQVMGPVVDVEFEDENLPAIRDALEVLNGDKKSVMEVAQHIGNNTVRCIMLASSEGLHRDMEVTATGAGIKTPVGEQTLGRLFNVLGEAIDGGAQPDTEEKWEIHREPPTFEEQNPAEEILETGIKVIDLHCPICKGWKNRTLRRSRSRKNSPHPGAHQQYRNRARRLLNLYRSRRAFQRGK